MRSSSGQYQLGLDHVRALAMLMVFCWHFMHSGNIIALDGANPALPVFAPFTNGYMGVSLFMVLSGYLFAGIADGKRLQAGAFLLNRAWRLLPMLAIALMLAFGQSLMAGRDLHLLPRLLLGWLTPSLPLGAWSITVEFHFYVLLPVLLWAQSKSRCFLPGLILLALVCRAAMKLQGLDLGYFAYYTMVGRLDQFLLGMLAYRGRHWLQGRHGVWFLAAVGFSAYASWLDHLGSLFNEKRDFSSLWLISGTIEGAFFAFTVAWYSESFSFKNAGAARVLALIGQSSYSMYLLHTFGVFLAARWIHQHVLSLENVHVALCAALLTYLAFVPVAHLSYRLIEVPFLRRRVIYALPKLDAGGAPACEAWPNTGDSAKENAKAA